MTQSNSRDADDSDSLAKGGLSARQWVGLGIAPIVYAWFQWGWAPAGVTPGMRCAAALTGLMAILWIFESVPLAATAMLPLVLLPIWGVATPAQVASSYANDLICLFIGGFVLANAIEHWGLHRRVALAILGLVGTRKRWLVLALMGVTAFVSLWISNTAAALLMMPVALGLLRAPGGAKDVNFAACLVMGVSVGASIGGMGTPIGSTPNLLLISTVQKMYDIRIGFLDWMAMGIPMVICFIAIAWWLFTRILFPLDADSVAGEAETIAEERRQLGPWKSGEIWVAIVFVLAGLAWIFREPRTVGGFAFGLGVIWPKLSDGTIAITAAVALMCVPVSLRPGRFALTWEVAGKIPWSIIILFGGGLALADAIQRSGLDTLMVQKLAAPGGAMPAWVVLILICAGAVILSEIASNTATAALLLPLVGPLSVAIGEHPLFLMLPVAYATSLGLMLPVATPPNALALATGHVTVRRMMVAGLILNLVGLILIVGLSYAVGFRAIGIPR